MKLTTRDRRALLLLGVAAALALVYHFWPASAPEAAASESIPQAEKRLDRLRRLAVAVPGREQALAKVRAALEQREKALIQAETSSQAQAQLLQILRRIVRAQQPPLEMGAVELREPRAFGDGYGEVTLGVSLSGRIEQILNLLADLPNQPEPISTTDLQVYGISEKEKTLSVRITFSALVPRKLVPQRRQGNAL
jgi:hypothetical protein